MPVQSQSTSSATKATPVLAVDKTSASQIAPINPVIPLSTPIANTFRHVQAALVLSLLAVRFRALVHYPAMELLNTLPIVVAIQVAYAIICLPAAGSEQVSKKQLKPGEKKKNKSVKDVSWALTALFALVLTLITVLPIHIGFILFGAPADKFMLETLLLAAHTAMLGVFPAFYTRGVNANAWMAMAGFTAPLDEVMGGLVGCLVGAWLGAVPIPLDWDRAWQQWPITVVVGMMVGGVVGKLAGTFLPNSILITNERWRKRSIN